MMLQVPAGEALQVPATLGAPRVPAAEGPGAAPLDINNLERALGDIQRIEATLKSALPGLQARAQTAAAAPGLAPAELDDDDDDDARADLDSDLLAETEAEEVVDVSRSRMSISSSASIATRSVPRRSTMRKSGWRRGEIGPRETCSCS